MKHSKDDLRQMQSLPLEAKILMTQRRIRDWVDYWNGDVYVSFSGGKDSTVLKHIVDGMYDDIPSVFVNTGLEYPEIQQFVRDIKAGKFSCFNPDVEIIRPEMRFDEVIKKYGFPVITKRVSAYAETARRNPDSQRARWLRGDDKTKFVNPKWFFIVDAPFKVSAECCTVMKKKPFKQYERKTGRKSIIGVMASEGINRENEWMKRGCNAFDAPHPSSRPLSFWTEQDILHYIKEFDVPYCPVYGEIRIRQKEDQIDGQIDMIDYLGCYEPEDTLETSGCSRTGCMFCMFGAHLEKEPNRFQQMKTTHPKQYTYCMDKLGLKEVLDYIGVPYE